MIALLEKAIDIIVDKLSSKPRLQFAITCTRPNKLDDKELRTKYSNSDYSIEIYNHGPTPFILERFTLVHKKGMLIECPVSEEDKTISQQKIWCISFKSRTRKLCAGSAKGISLINVKFGPVTLPANASRQS